MKVGIVSSGMGKFTPHGTIIAKTVIYRAGNNVHMKERSAALK
ncbi:MAG: hypothetical protein AMDU3_IPLC00004G0022 [Thermoplasmatales archaeon I-plasma]|jgi:hypothetical protein|nr:MAG: hypothetical protein AMDU3_IPLC00004G0022 [Thermoplasmatales archaeon I-plasma]